MTPRSTMMHFISDADSDDIRRDVGDTVHRPLQLRNASLDLVGILFVMHCSRNLNIMQGIGELIGSM